MTLTHVQRSHSYSSDCSTASSSLFPSGCGGHDAVYQWLVDIDRGRSLPGLLSPALACLFSSEDITKGKLLVPQFQP